MRTNLVIWDSSNIRQSRNRGGSEANLTRISSFCLKLPTRILIIKIFMIILKEKEENRKRETSLRKSEKVEDQ